VTFDPSASGLRTATVSISNNDSDENPNLRDPGHRHDRIGSWSLSACGWNENGELGLGDNTTRNMPTQVFANGVAEIAAGGYHSLILMTDGSLWATGYNRSGTLGLGTTPTATVRPKFCPRAWRPSRAGKLTAWFY